MARLFLHNRHLSQETQLASGTLEHCALEFLKHASARDLDKAGDLSSVSFLTAVYIILEPRDPRPSQKFVDELRMKANSLGFGKVYVARFKAPVTGKSDEDKAKDILAEMTEEQMLLLLQKLEARKRGDI